ncbi:MAG: bifunctional riboflavin kinase/FMN adenylyltransferase, partial [Pseudomonadota bacterium]
MYRHRDLSLVPAAYRGAAAAMGNFDGIHRGHRAVIDRAAAADAPLGIVTFEPHPRSYFAPESPPFRLMTADTRARRLDTLGVEMLYELPFTAALAGLEAEVFVADVLAARLGLSHLVVGADFRFGRGRRGDAAMLVDLGAAAGITVEITPLVEDDAVAVSSSAIRAALAEGRPGDAAAMLGDWHRIEGRVE